MTVMAARFALVFRLMEDLDQLRRQDGGGEQDLRPSVGEHGQRGSRMSSPSLPRDNFGLPAATPSGGASTELVDP
jgi:hypothetical protein